MPVSVSNNLARIITSRITPKERDIEVSMKKMVTGQRIHKGADDASGMHMANRLESRVRALTVTISQKKDTLNSLYTAEGGIRKVGDLLQRLRELALQAQTDTTDFAQRQSLNAEAENIKSEINRIGTYTESGGLNLLDGTFNNKSIQFGANPQDVMILSIDSIKPDNMLFIRDDLTMKLYSTPYIIGGNDTSLVTSNANKIAASTFFLSGHEGFGNISISNGMTAKQFAAAINSKGFGVEGSAVTKAELFGLASASGVSFKLGANTAANSDGTGTTISATITNVNDLSSLVTAINNQTGATGVSAEIANSGASVILTDEDGDDIFISHMDFTPEGAYAGNTPESNQNKIYARALDKDGIRANVANINLGRGVGIDEIVEFIDKDRFKHIDQEEGVVSVTVNSTGSGYASAPTVTISGGNYSADASGATGAIARYSANLTNGAVSSITRTNGLLTDRGRGYDQQPTVTLSAPPTQNFNTRSAINISTERITLNNHNLQTRDPVYYSNGGGTTLNSFTSGTTYYAIRHDANTISLAASATDATNGTAKDLAPSAQRFNSRSATSVTADTITISNHPFQNGDTVEYSDRGGRTLRGLTSGNSYKVTNVSGNNFKLTELNGTPIDLLGMEDSFNAQSNVAHSTNRITVSGHNLSNLDRVTYSAEGGTAIGGLSNGNYYVKSISGDSFLLSTASNGSNTVDIIARKTGTFNALNHVDLANNRITAAGHTLSNGDQVTYTTNSGTAIGPLTNGGTYYVKNISGTSFEVSSNFGGVTIDLLPEQGSFNASNVTGGNRLSMSHNFSVNDRVTYSAGAGTEIGGLTDGQDYLIQYVSGSYVRLEELGGGGAISLTAGSSETHTLTGQNSGSSENHTFNGLYAGENETHSFTSQYAGPSQSHKFTSTEYAGHSQNHTIKGHTATATAVRGEDDVADTDYYSDITQDYERTALVVGTTSLTSNQAIRINADHPTEKLGFFGDTFSYEASGQSEGFSLPPVKTLLDVNFETFENAKRSMDYINAGIDKFVDVSNQISVDATRLSYSVENTVNALLHTKVGAGNVIDVDYAIETTTFTVGTMVKETSMSLLAQANAPKQAVSTLVSNVMETQWDPTYFLVQGGNYRYKNI